MMTEDKKERFRRMLSQQLNELLSDANKTVNDMAQLDDTFPDSLDRAYAESERNFMLRIREREQKLIHKLQEALDRLENDSFGICEECEEEISEARMMARPVTTLCIECKRRQEVSERVRGL
jgi:DnaK suppressor protein